MKKKKRIQGAARGLGLRRGAQPRRADYVVDKAAADPGVLKEILAFLAFSRKEDLKLIRTLDDKEIERLVGKGVFYVARFSATGTIVAMLHLRETHAGGWEFGAALVAPRHRAFGLPHCLGTICILAPHLDPALAGAGRQPVEIEAMVLPGNEPPKRVLRRLHFLDRGPRLIDTRTDPTLAPLAAPGTHTVELCLFEFDPSRLGRIVRRMARYRDQGRLSGTTRRRADAPPTERTVRVDVVFLQDPLMRLSRRVANLRPPVASAVARRFGRKLRPRRRGAAAKPTP